MMSLSLERSLDACETDLYHPYETIKSTIRRLLTFPPQRWRDAASEEAFFTDHGVDHAKRVARKASDMVDLFNLELTCREIFLLLLAVWTHDLGMLYGRQERESALTARQQHHERSANLIQRLKSERLVQLNQNEADALSEIVRRHRVVDVGQAPQRMLIEDDNVRIHLLAAILRICDACDLDYRRAPKAVFSLLCDEIPESSKDHWRRHQLVSGVRFDPRTAKIQVSVRFDDDSSTRVLSSVVANSLRMGLEGELESVYSVFYQEEIPLAGVEIVDLSTGRSVDFTSDVMRQYRDCVRIALREEALDDEGLACLVEELGSLPGEVPVVLEIDFSDGPVFSTMQERVDQGALRVLEAVSRACLGAHFISVSFVRQGRQR